MARRSSALAARPAARKAQARRMLRRTATWAFRHRATGCNDGGDESNESGKGDSSDGNNEGGNYDSDEGGHYDSWNERGNGNDDGEANGSEDTTTGITSRRT